MGLSRNAAQLALLLLWHSQPSEGSTRFLYSTETQLSASQNLYGALQPLTTIEPVFKELAGNANEFLSNCSVAVIPSPSLASITTLNQLDRLAIKSFLEDGGTLVITGGPLSKDLLITLTGDVVRIDPRLEQTSMFAVNATKSSSVYADVSYELPSTSQSFPMKELQAPYIPIFNVTLGSTNYSSIVERPYASGTIRYLAPSFRDGVPSEWLPALRAAISPKTPSLRFKLANQTLTPTQWPTRSPTFYPTSFPTTTTAPPSSAFTGFTVNSTDIGVLFGPFVFIRDADRVYEAMEQRFSEKPLKIHEFPQNKAQSSLKGLRTLVIPAVIPNTFKDQLTDFDVAAIKDFVKQVDFSFSLSKT